MIGMDRGAHGRGGKAAARAVLRAALIAGVLAATSPAGAAWWDRESPQVLSPYEILTTVRTIGLTPFTDAVRRGHHYVLYAYDPYGIELRVVADAQFGDILSISRAGTLPNIYIPPFEGAPKIIHVEPPAEENKK